MRPLKTPEKIVALITFSIVALSCTVPWILVLARDSTATAGIATLTV